MPSYRGIAVENLRGHPGLLSAGEQTVGEACLGISLLQVGEGKDVLNSIQTGEAL